MPGAASKRAQWGGIILISSNYPPGGLSAACATWRVFFTEGEASVAAANVVSGDPLVLYTDGVTEAEKVQDVQFGESRLIETMLAHRHLPVGALLKTIVAAVQKFNAGPQADDITLVVAKRIAARVLMAAPVCTAAVQ